MLELLPLVKYRMQSAFEFAMFTFDVPFTTIVFFRDRLVQLEKERQRRMHDLGEAEDSESDVDNPGATDGRSGDALCDDYSQFAGGESDQAEADRLSDSESTDADKLDQAIKLLSAEKKVVFADVK